MMMPFLFDTQTSTFNNLEQRLQDDAYTLAYYLLGNENLAETATESVFTRFTSAKEPRYERYRTDVFRGVLSRCRQERIPVTGRRLTGDISAMLQIIDMEERTVVVLVDVLGLSYDETARVLDLPKKQIMRLLAKARLNLAA